MIFHKFTKHFGSWVTTSLPVDLGEQILITQAPLIKRQYYIKERKFSSNIERYFLFYFNSLNRIYLHTKYNCWLTWCLWLWSSSTRHKGKLLALVGNFWIQIWILTLLLKPIDFRRAIYVLSTIIYICKHSIWMCVTILRNINYWR